MSAKVYFPGSFNPPTYGHLAVLQKACNIFDFVSVVVSVNPNKTYELSPETRVKLWESYQLPENCRVVTLGEVESEVNENVEKVVVRGLRAVDELKDEMNVFSFNHTNYGLDVFLYILTEPKCSTFSSTRCRNLAKRGDLKRKLTEMICADVEDALLEEYSQGHRMNE